MAWVVIFHEAFDAEFLALPRDVQTALAAKARLLESMGPMLGRPHVDTLKNSKHGNRKELRFDAADGVWRVAFAFDAARQAVVLVAGDKSGGGEARFYRGLIATAAGGSMTISRGGKKGSDMARTLDEVIGGLPPDQQRDIAAQAAQLVEEEMTLRDLRRAHALTQTRMAEALHISQDGVSRIERRSDFLLSTLRSYVEAMGGQLRLVAEFPNRKPVTISGLGSLGMGEKPPRRGHRPTGTEVPA